MIQVEWPTAAIAQQESLDPQLSFETNEMVDLLMTISFPWPISFTLPSQ